MVEQVVGELGGVATVVTIEQVTEPLELVEDHQIRFQGVDRRLRQRPPQAAHQPFPVVMVVLAWFGPAAEPSDHVPDVVAQREGAIEVGPRGPDLLTEPSDDHRVPVPVTFAVVA
jgi:hypothetical protein